ncbi:MAG: molybdopterin molybdotransferase MoeA [Sphingopyxis sp.]
MILLEDAQQHLLSLARPTAIIQCPLADCLGRWLAQPLVAQRTQPWADVSAMDGFAIAYPPPAALDSGSEYIEWPVVAAVSAQSAAPAPLAPGQAARIFTGAPIPPGADQVVMQEDVASVAALPATAPATGAATGAATPVAGGSIRIIAPLRPGAHIRRAGQDFSAGDTLLPAGTLITPAVIALAAMAGHGMLPVHARPTIHLLATGSELVPAGSTQRGLPSSNSPMLHALLRHAGATVDDGGIVADDLPASTTAICRADADILITTGGASVGDHDLVKPALHAAGWQITAHKVAIKPGKPVIIATHGHALAVGLPGNPVSAYVTALLFVAPLIRRMMGCPAPLPHHRHAPLAAPLPAGGTRVEYVRAHLGDDGRLTPMAQRDSSILSSLAQANALVRVDIDAPPQPVGAMAAFITTA